MPRNPTKTLSEHFLELIKIANKNSLTIKEISLNTGVDEELINILFSNKHNLVSDMSKIFKFLKYPINNRRIGKFNTYKIYDNGTQIKITRVIEPKAYIYYDRITAEFYKFSFKINEIDKEKVIDKDLIISGMYIFLEDYMKNKGEILR